MTGVVVAYLVIGSGLAAFFALRLPKEGKKRLTSGLYVITGERMTERRALAWIAAFIATLWPLVLTVALIDAKAKP